MATSTHDFKLVISLSGVDAQRPHFPNTTGVIDAGITIMQPQYQCHEDRKCTQVFYAIYTSLLNHQYTQTAPKLRCCSWKKDVGLTFPSAGGKAARSNHFQKIFTPHITRLLIPLRGARSTKFVISIRLVMWQSLYLVRPVAYVLCLDCRTLVMFYVAPKNLF